MAKGSMIRRKTRQKQELGQKVLCGSRRKCLTVSWELYIRLAVGSYMVPKSSRDLLIFQVQPSQLRSRVGVNWRGLQAY